MGGGWVGATHQVGMSPTQAINKEIVADYWLAYRTYIALQILGLLHVKYLHLTISVKSIQRDKFSISPAYWHANTLSLVSLNQDQLSFCSWTSCGTWSVIHHLWYPEIYHKPIYALLPHVAPLWNLSQQWSLSIVGAQQPWVIESHPSDDLITLGWPDL